MRRWRTRPGDRRRPVGGDLERRSPARVEHRRARPGPRSRIAAGGQVARAQLGARGSPARRRTCSGRAGGRPRPGGRARPASSLVRWQGVEQSAPRSPSPRSRGTPGRAGSFPDRRIRGSRPAALGIGRRVRRRCGPAQAQRPERSAPLGLFGPTQDERSVRQRRGRSGRRVVGAAAARPSVSRTTNRILCARRTSSAERRVGDRVAEGRARARRSAQRTASSPPGFGDTAPKAAAQASTVGPIGKGTMAETVAHVVGARPNFMKAAPVIRALDRAGRPAGRHPHRPALRRPDVRRVLPRARPAPSRTSTSGVGSGSHAVQTASDHGRPRAARSRSSIRRSSSSTAT